MRHNIKQVSTFLTSILLTFSIAFSVYADTYFYTIGGEVAGEKSSFSSGFQGVQRGIDIDDSFDGMVVKYIGIYPDTADTNYQDCYYATGYHGMGPSFGQDDGSTSPVIATPFYWNDTLPLYPDNGACIYYSETGVTIDTDLVYGIGLLRNYYQGLAFTGSASGIATKYGRAYKAYYNPYSPEFAYDSNIQSYNYILGAVPIVPPGPGPTDTSTKIIWFSPLNGSTVATGTVPINIQGYINEADDDTSITVSLRSAYDINYGITPSSGLLPGVSAPVYPVNTTISLTNIPSGEFDITATTTINVPGVVNAQVVLGNGYNQGSFGLIPGIVNIGGTTLISTTSSFIVGTTSRADIIAGYITNQLNQNANATSTVDCSFAFNTSFIECMLIPPLPLLNATFRGFYDDVLTRFPIGLATRLYSVVTNTATSSIPVVTWISPNALGFLGNLQWDIDIEGMLRSSSNPFFWTDIDWGGENGIDGETIWQKMEPIYSPIVYGAYVILIIWFIIWRRQK